MSKTSKSFQLENGVSVEFVPQENRYFGDYHRLQIDVIAKIPLDSGSLPADLIEVAEKYSGSIKYEKTLERMGVASNQLDIATQSMIDGFMQTVGCYLANKSFAEHLLRKTLTTRAHRNRFSR
ncbi:hypothetical protein [Desulfuromusa kysingii]|nr:hypothetical protein [Desulfuromusa kysingii]